MQIKPPLLLAGLFTTLACASIGLLWSASDPVFHGKRASDWIKAIDYNGSDEQTKQWRAFGPDGVRLLLRNLDKANSPWRKRYRSGYLWLAPRLPLGLTRLLPAPTDSRGTRVCVISLLCRVANDTAVASPPHDQNGRTPAFASGGTPFLDSIGLELKRKLLPYFIEAIEDSGNPDGALALGCYPEQAQLVAPVLVKLCQAPPNPQTHLAAAIALNQVDPQAGKSARALSIVIGFLNFPGDQFANLAASHLRDFSAQPDLVIPALIEMVAYKYIYREQLHRTRTKASTVPNHSKKIHDF